MVIYSEFFKPYKAFVFLYYYNRVALPGNKQAHNYCYIKLRCYYYLLSTQWNKKLLLNFTLQLNIFKVYSEWDKGYVFLKNLHAFEYYAVGDS